MRLAMGFRFRRKRIEKIFIIVVFFLFCVYVIFYKETYVSLCESMFISDPKKYYFPENIKYLVNSSKCFIPNLDPFTKDVMKYYIPDIYYNCRNKELLTYVSKINDTPFLHIRKDLAGVYYSNTIICCFSYITRTSDKNNPDDGVNISDCVDFKSKVILEKNTILVKCRNGDSKRVIYENTHAFVTKKEVKEKLLRSKNSSSPHLSLLFIGIDSISRLNSIRNLPKTRNLLQQNEWIELKGYNKIGDNTFPNIMAVFTGRNESFAFRNCLPEKVGGLDKCNLLWYDYRKAGFITTYVEDEVSMNTFNYYKKGFKNPPTDFYFRPYMIASEKLPVTSRFGMTYCTGPESSGERIFNVIKDFASTFKNYSNFGVFWMSTFSHNDINTVSGMDQKLVELFQNLTADNILDNTIIVFLSDHGTRFGNVRHTSTGWYEERLPFIFFSIPKWFQLKYPKEYENLKMNVNRLTSPHDLYMTLQDVLVRSGADYTMVQSEGCPKCRSLFSEIPEERSCEDAAIGLHYCTCTSFTSIDVTNDLVTEAAIFILKELEKILVKQKAFTKQCAKYKLDKIMSSSVSKDVNRYKKEFVIVMLKTKPEAVFEATVSKTNGLFSNKFVLEGDISRLDFYSSHSKCVQDAYLKKYCFCE